MTDLSHNRILLVDDDKDFCFLIRMMLKKTGADLSFVYDGNEALEFMEKQGDRPADLVMLDIQMPFISGYTLLDVLKSKYQHIPVLAITAFGMLGEREKCLRLGFDEYLAKPFEEKELLAIIVRLISQEK